MRGLLSYKENERLTISQAEEKISQCSNYSCIGSFKTFDIAYEKFLKVEEIIEKLKNANFKKLNYNIL